MVNVPDYETSLTLSTMYQMYLLARSSLLATAWDVYMWPYLQICFCQVMVFFFIGGVARLAYQLTKLERSTKALVSWSFEKVETYFVGWKRSEIHNAGVQTHYMCYHHHYCYWVLCRRGRVGLNHTRRWFSIKSGCVRHYRLQCSQVVPQTVCIVADKS